MREQPWAAIPLINPEHETLWYASRDDAEQDKGGKQRPDEGYTIRYLPGRKAKVKREDTRSSGY